MAKKTTKRNSAKKPQVKVRDLKTKKDPKGGTDPRAFKY